MARADLRSLSHPGDGKTPRQAKPNVSSPRRGVTAERAYPAHPKTASAAAAAAMVSVMFMGSSLITPLYVLYEQTYGFSRIVLTLVYAAYVIGNLTGVLFFGGLSDRLGRRRIGLAAIALGGVAAALFLFAGGTPWLFAARIVSGFSIGIGAGAGAAWIVELDPAGDRSRAATIATGANFLGLAIGPLLAGLLVQYAPWPLRLPLLAYMAILAFVAWLVSRTPETIAHPARNLQGMSFRPKLALPAGKRIQFIAPAVTVFGALSLTGFYAALTPTVLNENLHVTNHAVGGLVVFMFFMVAALSIVATRNVGSRLSMLCGLALLVPSVAFLVVAQALGSMPVLIVGLIVSGIACALGYRGSLQVVNEIAPPDRRAEMVSTYFLCAFVGNAIPIVGVGVISTFVDPVTASVAFAAMIALFSLAALPIGAKYTRPRQA